MAKLGDRDVVEELHALMFHLRGQMHLAAKSDLQGLAPVEAKALMFFARTPGGTQSDLAQHSGRDKAQIARLVKQLQERGLLQSQPDANDKRRQCISLTAEGQALHRAMQQHRKRLGLRLVAGFSEAEMAQLSALIARMLANAQAGGGG